MKTDAPNFYALDAAGRPNGGWMKTHPIELTARTFALTERFMIAVSALGNIGATATLTNMRRMIRVYRDTDHSGSV